MRSTLLALPVVLSLAAFGCASPEAGDDTAASNSELNGGTPHECVIDTITVKKGFLADFKSAVGTSFIKDFGGHFYPHIRIPGVFDAALSPTDEFGEWFYTIIGLNIEPEALPQGSTAAPRLTAILTGGPVDDPLLKTEARAYGAAKAVFDAMTRAKETTTVHQALPHSFDQSWTRVRRESAAGRVVCDAVTNQDTAETRPLITCTFFDIERTSVQIFSTTDTDGRCLAE